MPVQDEDHVPVIDAIPKPKRDQYLDDYIAYFERMHQKSFLEAQEKASKAYLPVTVSLKDINIFGEVQIKLSTEIDFPTDIKTQLNR